MGPTLFNFIFFSHDFLVFLTGQEEIESLAYNIRKMLKVVFINHIGLKRFMDFKLF